METLFVYNVRLNKNSKERFIRKMSEYQKNIIDEKCVYNNKKLYHLIIEKYTTQK